MSRLARFLAIIMLAAFAVNTAAHGARATGMAFAMPHAGMAASMDDCHGCPPADDGAMLKCSQACLASFAALPAPLGSEIAVSIAEAISARVEPMAGRTGPPDPHPPRTVIPG